VNATEAKATAEKALAEFSEIKKATEAHEAAEKASTQALPKSRPPRKSRRRTKRSLTSWLPNPTRRRKRPPKPRPSSTNCRWKRRKNFKPVNDKFNAASKALTDAEAELKKTELPKSNAEHELQLATKAAGKTEEAVTTAKAAIQTAEEFQKQSDAEVQAAKKSSTGIRKTSSHDYLLA